MGTAFLAAAVASLTLVPGTGAMETAAQERAARGKEAIAEVGGSQDAAGSTGVPRVEDWAGSEAAARVEDATGSGWEVGIEIGDEPAGLVRWQVHDAGWTFGAGATAGPGTGDVRLRLAPGVRLQRTLVPGVRIGAGLGLEWTRLARDGNDEESELQWSVDVGWQPAHRVLTEAGIRWTDYRNRRATGYARVAVPLGTRRAHAPPESSPPTLPPDDAGPPPPDSGTDQVAEPVEGEAADTAPATPATSRLEAAAPVHASLPGLGVPPTSTTGGRLHLSVEPVRRSGSGIVLVAANPRGDPDPRSGIEGGNVDRLGLGTETWASAGAWSGWARWRSDLHTDPSIAERTRAATEGRFFPVSVSFSGGARWSPDQRRLLDVAVRHDPQALLWLPHLGQERTARVGTAQAEGSLGRVSLDVEGTRLDPMEGRSVDALEHARARVDVATGTALRLGLEHERLDTPGGEERRNRAVLQRSGRLSARLLAGDDLALRVGASAEHGPWRGDAWASYRSEPELLHYDRLVADGWTRPGPPGTADPSGAAGAPPEDGDVWAYGLRAGRGPFHIALSGTVGDPVGAPDSLRRAAGGTVDLAWTDRLAHDRIEGRLTLRVAEWGPQGAWWREQPTAEGWMETRTPVGPALLSVRVAARTEATSARAGLTHPGGAELGVGLTGPLPDLGSLRGMTVSMRLDDLLDSGLPVRVGAPERGRRLTLSLAWMSRSGVHR